MEKWVTKFGDCKSEVQQKQKDIHLHVVLYKASLWGRKLDREILINFGLNIRQKKKKMGRKF